MRRRRRLVRIRMRSLVSLLVLVAVATVWWAFLAPPQLGGPARLIFVSGTSMEPLLRHGDLAVVRRSDRYQLGDVVAYRVPEDDVAAGALVIHRIVAGGGARGYELRGDNRRGLDLWHPREDDMIGELWFFLPRAGHVLAQLRSPIPFAAALAVLTFLLIVGRPSRRPSADVAAGASAHRQVDIPRSGVRAGSAADDAPVAPTRTAPSVSRSRSQRQRLVRFRASVRRFEG